MNATQAYFQRSADIAVVTAICRLGADVYELLTRIKPAWQVMEAVWSRPVVRHAFAG